jgi:hypothetical protein
VLASANRFATVLASANNPATCTCEFLSWGVWASSVPDPRNNGKTYTAYGTYVAGTPTTAVQLPQTGNAIIYSGFMAGLASHNGQINPLTGSYKNTWDFSARTGNLNITFGDRHLSGTTQATTGSGFTGSFGRTGRLNGSFFASPSDAAAYQAGTFSIGGNHSRFQASGVFAGQR